MSKDNKMSRRSAITGIGAVLATVAVGPAMAGEPDNNSGTDSTLPEDPTTKYPRPPFKEQSQPWPGLASKMDPKPDH
ncbi:dehydrogenase, partial [Nostoc linckia z16]